MWLTFDQDPIDHYGRTLAYVWECEDDFDATQCHLFNARLITE